MLEGHVALGEALCHVLKVEGYDARYFAAPPPGLLTRLRTAPPAVVVVGVDPTGLQQDRLALIAGVSEIGIPVVGLTGQVDDGVRRRLLRRAGADTVVGRNEPLQRFVEVVAMAHSGELPGGDDHGAPEAGDRVVDPALDEIAGRLLRLTARERAVLELLRDGRTVDEIARINHVERSTVRVQVASVLRKLEVSSQLAAVALLRWVTDHDRPGRPG